MSSTSEQEWAATLDRFEAGLDHHARTLALAGSAPSGAAPSGAGADTTNAITSDAANPWPPANLPTGPIPSSQVDRARALNARCDELQDGVVAALAEAINPPRRTGARLAAQGQRSTPDHPRISITL